MIIAQYASGCRGEEAADNRGGGVRSEIRVCASVSSDNALKSLLLVKRRSLEWPYRTKIALHYQNYPATASQLVTRQPEKLN